MNVRQPMDVLDSFSIKNIFYDKWTQGFFILMCGDMTDVKIQSHSVLLRTCLTTVNVMLSIQCDTVTFWFHHSG